MGLKEILDEISRESDQEYNEAIGSAKLDADKSIVEAMDELELERGKEKDSFALELKRMRIKLTAKVELEIYRERQKLEVNMIGDLLEESFGVLLNSLKENRDIYKKFLIKLIRSSIDLLGTVPVNVSFNRDDRVLFDEIAGDFGGNIRLAEDVKIDAGVICTAGGSYVDNSLENIFEKYRPVFLKMISLELNKL